MLVAPECSRTLRNQNSVFQVELSAALSLAKEKTQLCDAQMQDIEKLKGNLEECKRLHTEADKAYKNAAFELKASNQENTRYFQRPVCELPNIKSWDAQQ